SGLLAALATLSLAAAAHAQNPPPKPEFQYQVDDIRISIPAADEPRVKSFGPDSIKAAAKYLEIGAVSWARSTRNCVNCHTTGPYLTEFTAWSRQFGKPSEEARASFVKALPERVRGVKEIEKDGHKYYPSATSAVWRTAGLAEWDKHVTGKLSEE